MRPFFALRLRTRPRADGVDCRLAGVGRLAYTQAIAYQNARERAIEDALQIGRLAASQQALIVDEARLVTDTLTRLPVLRSDNAGACDELLRRILSGHPAFNGIGAVDPYGSTV